MNFCKHHTTNNKNKLHLGSQIISYLLKSWTGTIDLGQATLWQNTTSSDNERQVVLTISAQNVLLDVG